MKEKRGKKSKSEQEISWKKTADLFESEKGLGIMKASRVLSLIEKRKLLGSGKAQQVTIRLPEDDLAALKSIAKKHDRKYQQLVVQAIEQFLDKYYEIEAKTS